MAIVDVDVNGEDADAEEDREHCQLGGTGASIFDNNEAMF